MKANFLRRGGLVCLLLALLIPGLAGADKKKFSPPPMVAKLAWLAGNWRMELNGRVADEQWMRPGGGVMLGMVRTVMKGRLLEHEFREIRGGPGGALYYVVRLSGQTESPYEATTLSETGVIFTNSQQDFPQTISYTLKPDDTLSVVQEGLDSDGQAKRTEISYQRLQP